MDKISEVRIILSTKKEDTDRLYDLLSEEHFRRFIQKQAEVYIKNNELEGVSISTEIS